MLQLYSLADHAGIREEHHLQIQKTQSALTQMFHATLRSGNVLKQLNLNAYHFNIFHKQLRLTSPKTINKQTKIMAFTSIISSATMGQCQISRKLICHELANMLVDNYMSVLYYIKTQRDARAMKYDLR